MKSLSFRKDLVGVQDELLRFAYKLTTDREEANDLLQETSLKALDNEDKYMPGCCPQNRSVDPRGFHRKKADNSLYGKTAGSHASTDPMPQQSVKNKKKRNQRKRPSQPYICTV